jgi:SAM-dependent methyltransferase
MWAQGDYSAVAVLLEPCSIKLADLSGIHPGIKALDLAAGTGNFALAAAERGAEVTACDLTPRMIELGRERTERSGHHVSWQEGDAEQLPFPDATFDLVATVFGAMFAPRPDRVASEMARVCRDGGLIVMANYSWPGFLGSMSKLFAEYSTPLPFELPSPFEWGEPAVARSRLDGFASSIEIRPDTLTMSFDSVDAGLEFWERTNAPTIALRMTLPPERYAEFQRDARQLMGELNESRDGRLSLTSSYLNVLARRRVAI